MKIVIILLVADCSQSERLLEYACNMFQNLRINRNIAATGIGCSFGQQRLPIEAIDCSANRTFILSIDPFRSFSNYNVNLFKISKSF